MHATKEKISSSPRCQSTAPGKRPGEGGRGRARSGGAKLRWARAGAVGRWPTGRRRAQPGGGGHSRVGLGGGGRGRAGPGGGRRVRVAAGGGHEWWLRLGWAASALRV
jgi:hypothetical protein